MFLFFILIITILSVPISEPWYVPIIMQVIDREENTRNLMPLQAVIRCAYYKVDMLAHDLLMVTFLIERLAIRNTLFLPSDK